MSCCKKTLRAGQMHVTSSEIEACCNSEALYQCKGWVRANQWLPAAATMQHAHLLMMLAELVLPIPGGPLSKIAFLDMSLGLPPPRPFASPGCSCFRCIRSLSHREMDELLQSQSAQKMLAKHTGSVDRHLQRLDLSDALHITNHSCINAGIADE